MISSGVMLLRFGNIFLWRKRRGGTVAKQSKGLRLPRSQRATCTITKDVAAEMEEIASRILHIKFDWKKPVTTTSAKKYLRDFLYPYSQEVFGCMFLDKKRRPICVHNIFYGRKNSVIIDPEVVVEKALEAKATAAIMYHSYPSDTTKPSRAEKTIVQLLIDLLAATNVSVIDHLIVCEADCFSFVEEGLLATP